METSAERIRVLNDRLRATGQGGDIVITSTLACLAADQLLAVLAAVQTFTAFNADNDPHSEHDFGSFTLSGQKFFFKLDYYDLAMEFGSEDPADPSKTTRVLTIMLAEEY